MPDILEIIVQLLNGTWRHLLLLIGSFAALGLAAVIAEFWPFGGDKTIVLNTFVWLAMASACGIYLFFRYLQKPSEPPRR